MELIVSILILGIVMGGVLHLFGTTLRLNEQTKKNTAMEVQARKVLKSITDDVKYGHTLKVEKKTDKTILTVLNANGNAIVDYTYTIGDKKLQRGTEYIADDTVRVAVFSPTVPTDNRSVSIILKLETKTNYWNTGKPLTHTAKTSVHTLPTT